MAPKVDTGRRSMKGIVSLLAVMFVVGCASPHRPKTNTAVPSLDSSKEINRQVRSNVVDSKDAIGRSRTLNQVIDNKLSILQDWK